MELARQVEENKRLRKSLLAQSTKFITLRQSTNISDTSLSTSIDYRLTPVRLKKKYIYNSKREFVSLIKTSASQSSPNSSRTSQSKSARPFVGNRGFVRAKTLYHGSNDPM